MFPALFLFRDSVHVQENCRRLPASVSRKIFGQYLAGEVLFSGPLPSASLFSCIWATVLSETLLAKRFKLATWIKDSLLTFDAAKQQWTAKWRSGVSLKWPPPGFGAQTDHQSLERHNGMLKQAMPANFSTLTLQAAAPVVERAVRTLQCADLRIDRQIWTHCTDQILFQPLYIQDLTTGWHPVLLLTLQTPPYQIPSTPSCPHKHEVYTLNQSSTFIRDKHVHNPWRLSTNLFPSTLPS